MPFDVIITSIQVNSLEDSDAVRLVRIPRLYRIIRILRLLRILKLLKLRKTKDKRSQSINNIQDILLNSLFVIYITCLAGCFFFFIPMIRNFEDDSWVWQKDLIDSGPARQFMVAFYWAFQTSLTIGYGDVVPKSLFEKALTVFWMLIGVVQYSYIIGFIINMINEYDRENMVLQG